MITSSDGRASLGVDDPSMTLEEAALRIPALVGQVKRKFQSVSRVSRVSSAETEGNATRALVCRHFDDATLACRRVVERVHEHLSRRHYAAMLQRAKAKRAAFFSALITLFVVVDAGSIGAGVLALAWSARDDCTTSEPPVSRRTLPWFMAVIASSLVPLVYWRKQREIEEIERCIRALEAWQSYIDSLHAVIGSISEAVPIGKANESTLSRISTALDDFPSALLAQTTFLNCPYAPKVQQTSKRLVE